MASRSPGRVAATTPAGATHLAAGGHASRSRTQADLNPRGQGLPPSASRRLPGALHAWELTRASGRGGAELLHHGDAVELRPDVGHATVLEAVEVHALDPDRLAGGGDPHEPLLLRTGHDPPGGDGVAAGDDVLQVLLQVGEARLEARDLLLEAGQRRLFVGRWIVVDQARVAELVDRRLVGRAKRVLEACDDLDVDRYLSHDHYLPRACASRRALSALLPICSN